MQKRCRDVLEELFFRFQSRLGVFSVFEDYRGSGAVWLLQQTIDVRQQPRNSFSQHCILTRTRWHPLDSDPPEGKHRRVMVDVQERELIVLLAEDEEERVGELQHLREVIPPNGIDNLRP
jgi:hypothetical protein